MTNPGFEISAQLKALNLSWMKWELGLNIGHYRNEITDLPEGSYITTVYDGEVLTAVGKPIGSFWGYKSKGVFATSEEAATAYINPKTGVTGPLKILNQDGSVTSFGAGDVFFEDLNQDGYINEQDKQMIGDPNPAFYGSFNSSMNWGRLTLNAVFSYSYGNEVYNYSRSKLESGSSFSNQTTAMTRRWTGEGQQTFQPKAVYGDPMGNARFSDRWIEDGSYLKLKEVSLSYKVPLKSEFMEGFDVWIAADNLWTLTNYLGLDPECSSSNSVYFQGIDAGLLPLTPRLQLGVKLNL
jgi:hypothetical protein